MNGNHLSIAAEQIANRNANFSTVASGGALALVAGDDLSARAATLSAGGDLSLLAGRDLSLLAGRRTQAIDQVSQRSSKSGGLFGKTRSESASFQESRDDAIGSTLSGNHVRLQAGRDVALEAATVSARQQLALSAGRDLTVAVAENTLVRHEQRQVSTKENIGFGQQSLKTTRDESSVTPEVSRLASGGDLTLSAGRDLTLTGAQVSGSTLNARAGGQLTVDAATATHDIQTSSTFKSNRLNLNELLNPSLANSTLAKGKIKLAETGSEGQAVVSRLDAERVLLQAGGDLTLVAPRIRADQLTLQAGTRDGETVNPDARIALLGVKERHSYSSSKNSSSLMHETVRDGGTIQETLLLSDIRPSTQTSAPTPAAATPTSAATSTANPLPSALWAPAATTQLALAAPGGIVVGATSLAPTRQEAAAATRPAGGAGGGNGQALSQVAVDLRASAQALSRQPGLAWLGELAQRDDVDWQSIALAQERWDYKHAGLTQAGAAIVAIAVVALTWGAGASLIGAQGAVVEGVAAGGAATATTTTSLAGLTLSSTTTTTALSGAISTTTMTTALGAAINAGFSTLASQAAVSLINHQGDIGQTLNDLGSQESVKQLVASMLTAGVGGYYSNTYTLESLLAKTATGCATGELSGSGCAQGAAVAGTTAGLAWAGGSMRQSMIADSNKFAGVVGTEDGTVLSNNSGQSVGVNGDGFKLAGGRVDLAKICGDKFADCLMDSENNLLLDAQRRVQYQGNLQKFIADNPELRSPMGGWQGGLGKFAFFNYAPGTIYDRIAEAYAGPHDMLNSAIWYDPSGNIRPGVTGSLLGKVGDITNYTNVFFATPFALPFLVPPEMIDAIKAGVRTNSRNNK